jgi:hypothetical protein
MSTRLPFRDGRKKPIHEHDYDHDFAHEQNTQQDRTVVTED